MYHVLIADDDIDAWFRVNALLRRYLIKAGFVTNLSNARQYTHRQTISLLFIGKQLQGHSTLNFIKYARLKHPFLKIILVNTSGDAPVAPGSGADIVISKPLVTGIIERCMIQLLGPALQACKESAGAPAGFASVNSRLSG
jgi:DNA-binding NtrC family response regulator